MAAFSPSQPSLNPKAPPFFPPPPQAPSWSKKLFSLQHIPEIQRLEFFPPLSKGEKLVTICSKYEVDATASSWEHAIHGFFAGKRPYLKLVLAALERVWNLQGSMEVYPRPDDSIIFTFSLQEDRRKVVDSGPWFILGRYFHIRPWNSKICNRRDFFATMPLWIRLPNLPLQFWSPGSISRIASGVGRPLFLDEKTAKASKLQFVRVCVEASATSTLPNSIFIEVEGDESFCHEQVIEYESSIKRCSNCAIFGHMEDECEKIHKLKPTIIIKKDSLKQAGGMGRAPVPTATLFDKGKKKEASDPIPSVAKWTKVSKKNKIYPNQESTSFAKSLGTTSLGWGEACQEIAKETSLGKNSFLVLNLDDEDKEGFEKARDPDKGIVKDIESEPIPIVDLGTAATMPRNGRISLEDEYVLMEQNRLDPGADPVAVAQASPVPLIGGGSGKGPESGVQANGNLERDAVSGEGAGFVAIAGQARDQELNFQNSNSEIQNTLPAAVFPPVEASGSSIEDLARSAVVLDCHATSTLEDLARSAVRADLVERAPEPCTTLGDTAAAFEVLSPACQITNVEKEIHKFGPAGKDCSPFGWGDSFQSFLPSPGQPSSNPCGDNMESNLVSPPASDFYSTVAGMEEDEQFPPGFTPDNEDMVMLRKIMKDGVSLVPPEHPDDFLKSVDLAEDKEIWDFLRDKIKENQEFVEHREDTNYTTSHNVRCSTRIRKKPAKLTDGATSAGSIKLARISDATSSPGLKKGFLK